MAVRSRWEVYVLSRPRRRPQFGERLFSDCVYGLAGGLAICALTHLHGAAWAPTPWWVAFPVCGVGTMCGAGLVGAVERRDPEWWRGEKD
jgi:hypothetical protein